MVRVAGPWIHSHLGPTFSKWLFPVAEEHLQKVYPGQPLLPKLLNVLTQWLYLSRDLASCPLSPGRQGNRATTGKHRERGRIIIFQVKPFLPPPFHRPRHGDFKVRIYFVPQLDMDDRAPRGHQLCFRILWMSDTKEVFPQIKIMVNP
jgi:hypothetical protein